MSVYVARRLIQSLVVLIGISVVVFVILHLTGDPTLLMLPPDALAEEVTRFRRAMGFDDPLPVQYWRFLRGVLQGNFGNSLRHDEPALGLVFERMPAMLELTTVALGIALLLAIPAGIVSATSVDPKARVALYSKAVQTWVDDGASILLYQRMDIYGVSKRVKFQALSSEQLVGPWICLADQKC